MFPCTRKTLSSTSPTMIEEQFDEVLPLCFSHQCTAVVLFIELTIISKKNHCRQKSFYTLCKILSRKPALELPLIVLMILFLDTTLRNLPYSKKYKTLQS